MERYPLLRDGKPSGELTTERDGLYTWFSATFRPCREGLWCAWAVGERGELRLGVLEPSGEAAAIRRRFSNQNTAPLGKLLRGEVRPAGERRDSWLPAPEPDRLFQSPWLRRQLRGVREARTCRAGETRLLALPYDEKQPFPLAPLFCLARLRQMEGRRYVVYAFNGEDWPVFGEDGGP